MIITTVLDVPGVRETANAARADDYLLKPFDLAVLRSTVQHLEDKMRTSQFVIEPGP